MKMLHKGRKVLTRDGVFASNASTLPITEQQKLPKKQENFIGIHFFHLNGNAIGGGLSLVNKPVNMLSPWQWIMSKKIRKTPIIVDDSRGLCFGELLALILLKD